MHPIRAAGWIGEFSHFALSTFHFSLCITVSPIGPAIDAEAAEEETGAQYPHLPTRTFVSLCLCVSPSPGSEFLHARLRQERPALIACFHSGLTQRHKVRSTLIDLPRNQQLLLVQRSAMAPDGPSNSSSWDEFNHSHISEMGNRLNSTHQFHSGCHFIECASGERF
jgi:hypothetical protein